RIIITRNKKIKNYTSKFILLKEQKPYDQFAKIVNEMNLKIDIENFFTRCILCNIPLEEIQKEKIADKIPPLTLQNTNVFYICSVCGKIYWKASHFDIFKEKIKRIIDNNYKK
ncbi:MAG: Mut7-C RNAse domain-containing protein, partial [Elusimicrobiales bacterium]